MELRPYQRAAVDAIANCGDGGHLIVMATGTGKTFTMATALAELTHEENVLWLAHRDELVKQALKVVPYNVHCETVQTAVRRMDKYGRFPIVVIDEAHHSAAKTYRSIIAHLKPRQVFGLTATPNRADGCSMAEVFQNIAFEYNLIDAVSEGYLARPIVRQVRTRVNVSGLKERGGDYATKELSRAINIDSRNKVVAQIVNESPKPCMVFAVDVEHAETLARTIGNGAVAVSGKTKKSLRETTFKQFLTGEIPVLVNCELYTEGADFPNARTVVLARPTQSQTLYIQMAGRVLRLAAGKSEGLIVDMVDATNKFPPCQAPTLIGLDPAYQPAKSAPIVLSGDLLAEIPQVIGQSYACFDAIIKSDQIVSNWARQMDIDTRNISFLRRPDGSLLASVPGETFVVPALKLNQPIAELQKRIDAVYAALCARHSDCRGLWDKRLTRCWVKNGASDNQLAIIRRFKPEWAKPTLKRNEASKLVSYIFGRNK